MKQNKTKPPNKTPRKISITLKKRLTKLCLGHGAKCFILVDRRGWKQALPAVLWGH